MLEDKNEDKQELVVQPKSEMTVKKQLEVVNSSPAALMQMATANGWDLNNFEKVLKLQREFDAEEARKAYNKDMAKFKKNPPKIYKDKKVGFDNKTTTGKTKYSHATLGNVVESISKSLAEYGFSPTFRYDQPEGKIKVTCIITHKLGHSESTSLIAGSDNTGNKNNIQAVGSTTSYLERYTILGLTGLATHDQDDDGKGADDPLMYIDDKQKTVIIDLLAASDSDIPKFLKWLNVENVDLIPASQYDRIVVNLESKVVKK